MVFIVRTVWYRFLCEFCFVSHGNVPKSNGHVALEALFLAESQ